MKRTVKVQCSTCGAPFTPGSTVCEGCGLQLVSQPQTVITEKYIPMWYWIAIAVVVIVILCNVFK